ncbi:DUF1740-domain-containing protein [Jaminaea rosea]|uniref:DUF1740-domain-containing protein n=1 Tax=Jaminaea rosea TaxID=1569628 RepID=A0A316UYD0_9BASI|nr:DUF1740-domain-containing protein [Jaminaea rosea]PWN30309.1 DUF1740-domain-containing protein [Jaminaea rosea]
MTMGNNSSKGKERAHDPPALPPTLDPSLGLIDKAGDSLSARYGSPEQSKVAKYKRSGSGVILGLDESLRILPEKSASQSTATGVLVGPKDAHRKGKSLLQDWERMKRRSGKRLATPRGAGMQRDEDFVSLGASRKQRVSQATAVVDPLQAGHGENRSSSETGSSDDENRGSYDPRLRQRLSDLDAVTRERPDDVQAWLELAQLQSRLVETGLSNSVNGDDEDKSERLKPSSSSRHRSNLRGLAEVQLSILNRARSSHPTCKTSVEIGLARLRVIISHALEAPAVIEKEWRRILPSDPQVVWPRYLEWRCCESGYSTHDVVDGAFAEAFGALSERHDATGTLIGLQQRLVKVLPSGGYRARAFAILQAQLEYCFACPEELEAATVGEKLDALEVMWESEVPRLGELGAVGWKRWWADRGQTSHASSFRQGSSVLWESPRSLLGRSDQEASSRDSELQQWLQRARRLSHRRAHPSRTTDLPELMLGEGEVDPYSVVFFCDVRPFIITDPRVDKEAVLLSMLAFLGLTSNEAAMRTAWPEDLVGGGRAAPRQRNQFDVVEGEPMQAQRTSLLSDLSLFPFRTGDPLSSEALWPLLHGFASLPPSTALHQGALQASITLLETLQPYYDTRSLQLKLLCLLSGPQVAAAQAKEFLAQEGEAWPLWRAFACLQRQLGNLKSARKVYWSCLMSEGLVARWGTQIWVEALELEIEAGEEGRAVQVAVEALVNDLAAPSEQGATKNVPTPIDVLRAKGKAHALALAKQGDDGDDPSKVEAAAILAGWLEYLTQASIDQRLSSAICAVNKLIAAFSQDTHRQLGLYRLLGRIITYHLSLPRPVNKPREVREVLLSALKMCKDCNGPELEFICLLAAHESRFKIEGILRSTVEEQLLSPLYDGKDMTRPIAVSNFYAEQQKAERDWLTALYLELHLHRDTVNAHAIRSLLERSVEQCEATKGSCALWRFYLSFELRVALLRDHHGETTRERKKLRHALARRVKPVFWRAIARCPWDLRLYETAFEEPLVRCFTRDELLQLGAVMTNERDLRVYRGWEEALARADEREAEVEQLSGSESEAKGA